MGAELVGLAGTAGVRADADGMITLPADGPSFGMWRLPDVQALRRIRTVSGF